MSNDYYDTVEYLGEDGEDCYFYTVSIVRDDTIGPPWEEGDGHGVVVERRMHSQSEFTARLGDTDYVYDYPASLRIALRDNWGCNNHKHSTDTDRAMCAVESDYEYLNGWANDHWWYVGIKVDLNKACGSCSACENETHIYCEEVKEIASESLWGIESDADEHIKSTTRELLEQCVPDELKHLLVTKALTA